MAQCDIGFPCKVGEKVCRLNYTSSWCPNCDKDSPRKRSKSENIDETCRSRRNRDLKSLSKKYDWADDQQCENMDLEYDVKDMLSDTVRWDRVRSNLCELPTTYISNNCLKVSNQDYNDISTDKSFKSCETNLNFGNAMVERHEKLNRFLPKGDESVRNVNGIVSKMKQVDAKRLKSVISVEPHFVQPISKYTPGPYNLHADELESLTVKRMDLHGRDAQDCSPIHYDTCSFFNRKMDIKHLQEQYGKEVEMLKEKLRTLKQSSLDKQKFKCPAVVQHQPEKIQSGESLRKMEIKDDIRIFNGENGSIIENVPLKSDNQLPSSKTKEALTASSKIRLKTKPKVANIKIKKTKAKNVVPNFELSDSDECSDSETSLKEVPESDSLDEISTASSNKELSLGPSGSGDSLCWPLRPSLFPHIPPYLSFIGHNVPTPQKFPIGSRHLKWKLSTITPILVRKTLVNSGFRLVRKSNEWVGTWGKHMKSPMFQTLKDTQKLNHFPGTFQVGRKDRLWRNFQRLIIKHGFREFGFTPKTYVLPQDLKLLKQHWHNRDQGEEQKYIIKPPASARGTGIKVINKWSQLPRRMSLVVQEYISNPLLINKSKFDLRLYVLVTSFNPLRIYLYPEGLARFASVPYSEDPKDLKDKFMHLTNYSINKLSNLYTANEDANACKGHKWTLTKLWEYMSIRGIDTKAVWKNLQQLVIKTMISGESSITSLCRGNMQSRYNCYELFGVDVLIDEHLKCWLLEVNISPSLHSQSPLDEHVKGPLIQSLFNLVQFHLPSKVKKTESIDVPPCYDSRIYTTTLTKKEINKHSYITGLETRTDYLDEILLDLTGDDVRHLTQAEDELTVIGEFQRLFPTSNTHKYFEFMEVRYYNRLFDAWETRYEQNRESGIRILKSLCEQKIHLKIAPPPIVNKSLPNLIPGAANPVVAVDNQAQNSVPNAAAPVASIGVEGEKPTKTALNVKPILSGLNLAAHTIDILSSINNMAV